MSDASAVWPWPAAAPTIPIPTPTATRRFSTPPSTRRPRRSIPPVAYTTAEHVITGNVYDTLLEYHYLERPYRLIPGLAEAVPEPQPAPTAARSIASRSARTSCFHDDPCFALEPERARTTREVTAADFAFALARIADPAVNSPVDLELRAGAWALPRSASGSSSCASRSRPSRALPVHEQYKRAGGIAGVVARGERELEIVLAEPNAQILYWFAMPFTTPVPWEAVAYYDGREGREHFADHPVGTGPYRLAHLREAVPHHAGAQSRLVRQPAEANREAPGAVFPGSIDQEDVAEGRIDPAYAGRRCRSSIASSSTASTRTSPASTSSCRAITTTAASSRRASMPWSRATACRRRWRRAACASTRRWSPRSSTSASTWRTRCSGTPAGERGRKLRQAMSLAIDAKHYLELFLNGRGVPAQSPVPPGIFGYDAELQEPVPPVRPRPRAPAARRGRLPQRHRSRDRAAAAAHLRHLGDDGAARLQFQFLADAWRAIGLDVEITATTYNQFQDKVRRGAYQIFIWGWSADFPDPENFLFLLECENARSKSGGPNTANFCDAEFDRLFREMKDLPNDERARGPHRACWRSWSGSGPGSSSTIARTTC